jgi:predicted secreted protein
MATIINGTNLRIYLGGVAIGEATSCSLDLSMETRETLTKDNVGSYTSVEPGRRSATLSTEGLVSYDTANKKVTDMVTAFNNGDTLIARFTTGVASSPYWEGSVILTALTLSAAVEENATYSATFTVKGAITQGTV